MKFTTLFTLMTATLSLASPVANPDDDAGLDANLETAAELADFEKRDLADNEKRGLLLLAKLKYKWASKLASKSICYSCGHGLSHNSGSCCSACGYCYSNVKCSNC